MLRSEEQLRIGTAWVAHERVTTRRRIVSETVQLTVTVRREELVIERAPIVDASAQPALPAEAPVLVLVLHEEVPVVTLEVQPYARATISVVPVTGEQVVTTALDTEHIKLETAGP